MTCVTDSHGRKFVYAAPLVQVCESHLTHLQSTEVSLSRFRHCAVLKGEGLNLDVARLHIELTEP